MSVRSTRIWFPMVLAALLCGCDGSAVPPGGDDGGTGVGSDAGPPGGDAGAMPDGGDPEPGALVSSLTVREPDGAPSEAGIVTFGLPLPSGHTFEGLVATLDGSPVDAQVDIKRRHDDGSVRHAVVAVQLPALEAGDARSLELRSAVASGTTRPSLPPGFDAIVEITDGAQVYTARAQDALGGETQMWLDGPLAVQRRAAIRPTDGGGSAHPAIDVYFDVRHDALGGVRVSVGVENTAHDTVGPVTYDVRILDGEGTVRFEQDALRHLNYARWRHVFTQGPRSGAFVQHDRAQLEDAHAIPRYQANLDYPTSRIESRIAAFEGSEHGPMQLGQIVPYMPQTGGRDDIGPLPEWTAVAVLTGDPGLNAIMNAHGELAGSFSTHIRDRETGQPIDIDGWPTLSLNPNANRHSDPEDKLPECTDCETPFTPDASHQPSLAYVPYLLSGDPYFLDELAFWVSYNFARQNQAYRENDLGLLHSNEARGQAWVLRTLAHAAWITPDAHPQRAYFEQKLQNNLDWYLENAVDSNPLGWWGSISNLSSNGGRPDDMMRADVARYTSPWQSDFLVQVMGWIAQMGYADAEPTHHWLAAFTVRRFTSPVDEYTPYDGAPYHIATEALDGQEYSTMAEMHDATFANRGTPDPSAAFPIDCAFCYSVIARMALATAVDAGLPEAEAAFNFVSDTTGAGNPYEPVSAMRYRIMP
ncbi:MAG: hypothetical protein AB8I08_00175 [Sandaracinaceae bacterium]